MTFIQGKNDLAKRMPARDLLRRWWFWVLVAMLVGMVAYSQIGKAAKTAGGAARPGANRAAQTVPVTAVAAKKGDIGIYLTGLGAVTPVRTVTVKSRVDGELMRIYY